MPLKKAEKFELIALLILGFIAVCFINFVLYVTTGIGMKVSFWTAATQSVIFLIWSASCYWIFTKLFINSCEENNNQQPNQSGYDGWIPKKDQYKNYDSEDNEDKEWV